VLDRDKRDGGAHRLRAAIDPGCANLGDAADFVAFSNGDFSFATSASGSTARARRLHRPGGVHLDGHGLR
jgi:hypothetical protein